MIQYRSFLMPKYHKPISHNGFYGLLLGIPVLNRIIAKPHYISITGHSKGGPA